MNGSRFGLRRPDSMVLPVAGYFVTGLYVCLLAVWNLGEPGNRLASLPYGLAASPVAMLGAVLLSLLWVGLPIRFLVGRGDWATSAVVRAVGGALLGPNIVRVAALLGLAASAQTDIHLQVYYIGRAASAGAGLWCLVMLVQRIGALPGMSTKRAIIAIFWPLALALVWSLVVGLPTAYR